MEKFKFILNLLVEVEAFDEEDAHTILSDYFGKGKLDDVVEIKKCSVKE